MSRRGLRRLVLAVAVTVATTAAAGTFATPSFAVVGGTVVAPADYPYFAKLTITYLRDGKVYGTRLCGGSVIGSGLVLTAAHCFLPKDDVPYAGVSAQLSTGLTIFGDLTNVHPLFNGDTSDGHDLALVQIQAAYTATIPWIQVGAPGDPGAYAPATPATIMGYGRTSAGGKASTSLRAATTELHSDDYMDDLYNKWYWFDYWPDDLAIGAGSSRRNVCFGDSGGPLVVSRNGVPVQVGVGSFTRDSCHTPSGFAELAGAQLAWLGTVVPSIPPTWGFCDAGLGTVGRYVAQYSTVSFAGAQQEGGYYWGLRCEPYEPPVEG